MQLDLTRLAPAPTFLKSIKADVRQIAEHSTVVMNAANGDLLCMHDFWRFLWPFVMSFTDFVALAKLRLMDERVFTQDELKDYVDILREMHHEEGVHADLWKIAARQAGMSYDEMAHGTLSMPMLPAVKALNASMRDDLNLENVFLCFTTTEMIAEEVSKLLNTPACLALHGGPVDWFDVHIDGADTTKIPYPYTHESICYNLADRVRVHRGEPPFTYEEARKKIIACAENFWECGEQGHIHRLLTEAEA